MDTNLPKDPIVNVNNQTVNQKASKKPRIKIHIPKIAILILFFIILLFLMEGGLFLMKSSNKKSTISIPTQITKASPTPSISKNNVISETKSGVKTYTNLEAGFSFEVPTDFKVTYDEIGSYLYKIYPDPNNLQTGINIHNFATYAKTLQEIESEATAPETESYNDTKLIIKKTLINVGGVSALKYEYIPNKFNTIYVAVINNKKQANQIEIDAFASNKQDLINITPSFEKILSTFKFIDSNASTTPSPTCRPRPSCLDSIPACKMAETADMCPPTPSK